MKNSRAAFTLIELSIVIVVLGLIVGAVLAGQSMIAAQRLRNVLQEGRTYASAVQQFSDKYGALPGDMADAERVWGNASGGDVSTNCGAPDTTPSPIPGTATCNGNGNGIIETAGGETFRAWQQLAAAGMIVGTYTGIAGGSGPMADVNVPHSAMTAAGFTFQSAGTVAGSPATYFDGNYDNMLLLSALPQKALLLPVDAYGMDVKADDGTPGNGNIRTPTGSGSVASYGTACVTTDVAATAHYRLNSSVNECVVLFLQTFEKKSQ